MPRVVVAGAAAVLLVGGVLVVQVVESPEGASAQAAAVLLVASRSAAEQPFTAPRPDEFLYVRTEASWGAFAHCMAQRRSLADGRFSC